MNKKKKLLITVIIFFVISVIYTLLVKFVDVKVVGNENVKIGFSSMNKAYYDFIGVKESWYKLTKILGLVPFLFCVYYGYIGVTQLAKYKSIKKVDKKIVCLGIFYVLMLVTYVFFEKVVINYRPVLEEGILEPSYPSSHTLLAICLCATSLIISEDYINEKYLQKINNLTIMLMIFLTVGRALSGYHWISDIIGGIIISIFLVSIYKYLIYEEEKV